MKFLADENFPHPLTLKIRSLGYSVKTIQELKLTGASDNTVSKIATSQKLILLTLDKDFLTGQPAKLQVIIFDFPNTTTSQISNSIDQLLQNLKSLKLSHHITLIYNNQGLTKIT